MLEQQFSSFVKQVTVTPLTLLNKHLLKKNYPETGYEA